MSEQYQRLQTAASAVESEIRELSSDEDNCECLMRTSDGLRIAVRRMPRPPRPLRAATPSSRGGRVDQEGRSEGAGQRAPGAGESLALKTKGTL